MSRAGAGGAGGGAAPNAPARRLDPHRPAAHILRMGAPFDTLAAANAGEPVTRPDLDAALAELEVRLTERMSAQFRWLVGVIVAVAGLAVAAAKYLP